LPSAQLFSPLLAAPPLAWTQDYTPHGLPWWACAAMAALPVVVLFWALAVQRLPAPVAAAAGAVTAILVAVYFVGMPFPMAAAAFAYGAAVGLLPIGWIVFAAMFLYQIAVDTGQFEVMKASIGRLTADRRLQVLLIAFSFGAILEGAAGFGTPVAICAALLVGLGFRPFPAAVLCLIANTAPVAWGSIGTPLLMLAKVSDLPIADLSAMNARILPITSVVVPLWLVRTMVPWKETLEVLPAILVCGVSFAVTQYVWGNHVDVGLVDIVAGFVSLAILAVFLTRWRPASVWRFPEDAAADAEPASNQPAGLERPRIAPAPAVELTRGSVVRAWLPFIVLFFFVVGWGLLREKAGMDRLAWGPLRAKYEVSVPQLDGAVYRTTEVVAPEKAKEPEKAVYELRWLSATGTSIFAACVVVSILLGHGARGFTQSLGRAATRMRVPILAITPMLGLAFVTRYSGMDAILGLAFTRTGFLYPFFGTFLGWLGVALTGSDTSSNALFGSLQRITAEKLGLSPILMCSANSAGGVMGKMIDAQSIVVSAASASIVGQEGKILLAVLWHSIALASIVAVIVLMYAYLAPSLIPEGVRLLF